MNGQTRAVETIIVGAGQAGLATGYFLKRLGYDFVILDANERVGDSWRKRWDSLRLFTSARYNGLPGMPFPASPHYFPTKDEMGDFLEAYAAHFELPVKMGMRVERLARQGSRFALTVGSQRFEARQVIVAMADYQKPRVPAFAPELDAGMVQLHSSEYRNPSQLQDGGVLLVGAGNSGAEIAIELAREHPTWLAGPNTGHIPFRVEGIAGRVLLVRLVLRVLFHRILTLNTPIGRKARPIVLSRGAPLVRVKPADLAAAGVERTPRVVGVRDGFPLLEDGRVLHVPNVIWCTGFHAGFSWIDLPIFGDDGRPRHDRGVAVDEPGMYFVGLEFLYSMSSSQIHGVGRDAERIASAVVAGAQARVALSADMTLERVRQPADTR